MQVSDLQQSLTVAHAEADGLRGRLAAADSLPADIDHLADEELRCGLHCHADMRCACIMMQQLCSFHVSQLV